MANYPQLDDARGVWKLHEVYDAVMGGYWPNYGERGLFAGGNPGSSEVNTIDYVTISSAGNATDFGDSRTASEKSGGLASFTRFICDRGNSPYV